MLNINKEENVFVTEIKKAAADKKKIYILGAANGAIRIAEGLRYRGLEFDGFVVDKDYYAGGGTVLEKEVLCIEDALEDPCVIIRSIANYPRLNELKKRACVIDEDVMSLSMAASDPFVYEFFEENKQRFELFFNSLRDDKSKKVMMAFLNQKFTGRFSEMADVWDKVQYFDIDFYDISKVGCLVDCGAYDGDSFESFCKEFERKTRSRYNGKAYLLDPDSKNQEKIKVRFAHSVAEIYALEIGAWNEAGTISFQSDENFRNAGKISSNGDVSIKVDKIDRIVGNNEVDFIKMDIEGAELNALKGASNCIIRDHPTLAICAYHKREDMIELSEYIRGLYPDYKFYLRAYGGPYSIELVLFAVP